MIWVPSTGKNLQIKKGIYRGLKYDMCISVCICTMYIYIYIYSVCIQEIVLQTLSLWGGPCRNGPLLRAACDFIGREAGPPYLTVLVLAWVLAMKFQSRDERWYAVRIYISLTADEEVQLVDSHALPRPGPTPEQEGSILPVEWSRDVNLGSVTWV